MKKVVFGVSALAVFLGVGWMLYWHVVEYGIVRLFRLPLLVGGFGSRLDYGEIPWFVVQCIALLVITVVTLPVGDFRLGHFFKDNRRHSLLMVFPLGLFAWIILCAIVPYQLLLETRIATSDVFSNLVHHIATVLLMAALAIAALCSLHIMVFRRTVRANIPNDPYSLNTGVLLGTKRASMPKDLSRYIFRVSMLVLAILATISLPFVTFFGIAAQSITTLVTATAALWIRIFTSGDFSENNKLFFGVVVFPLVVWVLCVWLFLLVLSLDLSARS